MPHANEVKPWSGSRAVPASACRFLIDDAVEIADAGQDDKGSQVRIVGYRGDIVKHWFWGNLVIDLDGLHFDKARTPGLIDHDPAKRLTYSRQRAIKPETFIAGPFLANDAAAAVKADMAEGFPFQASMDVRPELVEKVSGGESVEVNGKRLKGPGNVFRKAAVMEISAVVFGAFSNTESSAFAAEENVTFDLTKEMDMTKDKDSTALEMTAEVLKDQYAETHAQVLAEGRAAGMAAEKERFAALQKACGEDTALLAECFASGLTTAEALQKRNEKLIARNAELVKLAGAKASDPAISEFREQEPPENSKTAGPATFMAAVDRYMIEHPGTKKTAAIDKCVDLYPQLHASLKEAH